MFELLIIACTMANGNLTCDMPITAQFDSEQQCNDNGLLYIDDMVNAGWVDLGYPFIEFTCKPLEFIK